MPVYNIHLYPYNSGSLDNSVSQSWQIALYEQIATLHATTFGCDPDIVRVEFVLPCGEAHSAGYGGYGYTSTKKTFYISIQLSDYIVVNMDFGGSKVEWEEYCQALVRLMRGKGRSLRSVLLQKVAFEFEVKDLKVPGVIVAGGNGVGSREELPRYIEG